MKNLTISAIVAVFSLASCGQTKDKQGEQAKPPSQQETNPAPKPDKANSPEKTTYELAIKPLIDEHCVRCHGSRVDPKIGDSAIAKENQALIVEVVELGFMPPKGPLAEDDIKVFSAWKNSGFPE